MSQSPSGRVMKCLGEGVSELSWRRNRKKMN